MTSSIKGACVRNYIEVFNSDGTMNKIETSVLNANETFTRKALNFGKNDIFFDQPRNMGIRGRDLGLDFERAITLI